MDDQDILAQFGGLVNNSLTHKLSPGINKEDADASERTLSEPQLINLSPYLYFNLDDLVNLLKTKQSVHYT